ncbi:hypothetical protein Ddye_027718 [Dipteronia dyeriana]|uniref:HMA domain-containing protein n=1 Tax=Dipteronia dyeriana TaxID=168575 RepID=A0AAD9TQG8_9ROSI|nr:hypothetical protein Ddye_027718 [Dipteronia dyeriana]
MKIVIMLKLKCDECRSKAMKIAAVAYGVISVAWERDEKNKVVMTRDGTDAAIVTGRLRKKLGYADFAKALEIVDAAAAATISGCGGGGGASMGLWDSSVLSVTTELVLRLSLPCLDGYKT